MAPSVSLRPLVLVALSGKPVERRFSPAFSPVEHSEGPPSRLACWRFSTQVSPVNTEPHDEGGARHWCLELTAKSGLPPRSGGGLQGRQTATKIYKIAVKVNNRPPSKPPGRSSFASRTTRSVNYRRSTMRSVTICAKSTCWPFGSVRLR